MSSQAIVSDAFFLSGEHLDRLRQALQVARHQARIASSAGYGRNVTDILSQIEDAVSDQLAQINSAVDDDDAEAEESGEAERERRSWFPIYRAA
jgi:hypothetical protein